MKDPWDIRTPFAFFWYPDTEWSVRRYGRTIGICFWRAQLIITL